jgi:hypothetical protein
VPRELLSAKGRIPGMVLKSLAGSPRCTGMAWGPGRASGTCLQASDSAAQRRRRAVSFRRLAVATLGIVAALLLFASPALAAPAWLSPIDLSAAGQDAGQPQVAVDPAGNAVAVWTSFNGTNSTIESASHPAGGTWSDPTKLSGENARGPQVAVDPAGNAVAVWTSFNGTNSIIESASHPLGGTWSEPTILSPLDRNAFQPQVAVDPAGNAVAVWDSSPPNDNQGVIESSSRPSAGSWSDPTKLSDPPAVEPQVAVDPAGNAVAVWTRFNGTDLLLESADLAVGRSWSDPIGIPTANQSAIQPQVAVDPAGNAVAVWNSINGPNLIVESASRPEGGSWSDPTKLSAPGERVGQEQLLQPQVAVDSSGNAVAVWGRFNGTNVITESATLPLGVGWSQPAKLSALGNDAYNPQVAVDSPGNAVAIWSHFNGANFIIESASRPPNGDWSQPKELSAAGEAAGQPQVAVDSAGNAVAIWSRGNTTGVIQAAAFDGAGPRLQGFLIPTAARAGSKLRFAVSPLDSWSALGQSSWSFGDRKSASGLSTTHAYAKPGRYQLTLRVGDALDNATSTSAEIKIAAKAKAARRARVRKGKAFLSLRCPKPAALPCEGLAKLRIRHGKKKKLVLGQRSFTIAGAKHRTLAIKLSTKAKHLLAAAGRKGLRVKLSGSGVSTQTLRLR